MVKKSTSSNVRLTETELEFMSILWKLGEGTVNDVLSATPRELAYTSVATILRLLEQKKILKSRKEGRGHIFTPVVSKAQYEESSLRHIVKNVFDNAPSALVMRLVSDEKISEDEMKQIKKFIEERL